MKYTDQLERRVAHLESVMSKNEGKQVGTLYHVCTLQSYLKYILPNDELRASGKYTNQIYGSDEFVSFTRDQFFVVGTKSVQSSKVLVQLVIDGDKLSEHYKVGPYNDFAFNDDDSPEKREKEEAAKGPIKHLSKYIKEIRVDVFDIDQSAINMIKKAKLVEKGAKYFHFIKGYQQSEVTNFMRENGIKRMADLSEAMNVFKAYVDREKFDELLFSYDIYDVKKALKAGADVNAEYPSGNVAENYCYSEKDIDILKLVLDKGVNVNKRLKSGSTLLCTAAESDNVPGMELLTQYGADVNTTTKDGYSPLMLAVKSKCKNAIAWLLANEADVNVKSNDGETALSLAKTKVLAKQLQKAGAVE